MLGTTAACTVPPVTDRAKRRQVASARPLTVRGLLGRFLLAGIVALSIAVVVTAWASRRSGLAQAERDARQTTWLIGAGIVQPALTPGIFTGEPDAIENLHGLITTTVLSDSLLRVKLWAADGTILYANDSRLIGMRFDLGEDEAKILSKGGSEAGMSDLAAPENQFDTTGVAQLEVYTKISGPGGEPLLFETYFRNSKVQQAARGAWRTYAPISLSALVVLQLAQIPVVWQLTKRLRREQAEREHLLRQAVVASANERRRIAADLHDGVVQDLSGLSFSLTALGRATDLPTRFVAPMNDAAEGVRSSVRGMRTLLVDLYPPNLNDEGLESALGSLLTRLSGQGITTTLDVSLGEQSLDTETTALLYRSAQEAIRNIAKHARAHSVALAVQSNADRTVLTVQDDGTGFDASLLLGPGEDGHVGMRVLADLVSQSGGEVYVESAEGRGTKVTVEVPA